MDVRALLDKIIKDAEMGERAPGRAVRWPHLRPYLPDRHALRRLIAGFAVLVRGLLRLLRTALRAASSEQAKPAPAKEEKPDQEEGKPTSGKDKKAVKKAPPPKPTPVADAAERLAMGVLGVAIAGVVAASVLAALGPLVLPYLPIITGVAVPGLLIAAWVAAPRQAPKKAAVGDGKEGPSLPPLDAVTVAAQVRQIAVGGGWKGAHLDDLLAHLPGRTKAELLTVLAEARIEVEDQLKIWLPGKRQRNRQGVRLSALPEGLGEAPPAPPQTPPQRPAQLVAEHLPESGRVTVHGGG